MGDTLSKSDRMVDEAFDAPTKIQAQKARIVGITVEQSSTTPTMDKAMHSGYQDPLFEVVKYEQLRDKLRWEELDALPKLDALELVEPSKTWESKSLVDGDLSFFLLKKKLGLPTSTMPKRRRWPRAGSSMTSPRDVDTHD